jgi:hypothetical protein
VVKIGKNTEGGNKTKLNKNAVLTKKKIKKKPSWNTVLPPTHRQKPTHKSPTAAGMRQHKRSAKSKKRHPK